MTAPLVVALALAAGTQATALPQPATADDRWQPWLGCWVADEDARGARTCVVPGADGGVSIVTLVGVQEVARETRIADDREHAVADGDCRGTERMRWSVRGSRVYRTATVACGAQPTRTLSGLTYVTDGPIWVDVQTVQRDGETSVRVRRYQPAVSQRLADGRQADQGVLELVSQPWTVDDVLEMSAQLPADAVEAVLGETRSAFALNARTLIRLSDAGVSERVIDLMVALTFPDHFVVESGGGSSGGFASFGAYDPFFSPILGPASLYGCYQPYGWADPDYWRYCGTLSPYSMAFGPGFYNGYYGMYGNGWVVTSPPSSPGDGGGSPGEIASPGRVVNGRGYTQITPVDGSAPSSSGGGGSNGFANGSGSNGTNSTSGSSGVSSGGYSGGGAAGSDGGRMAMPRPPGR